MAIQLQPSNPFAAAWQFRELFRQLVVRNLKVRYQRSGLGFFWLLCNPALTIGVLVFVFGYVVRLQVESYWAFLISGYFAWVFLLHTLSTSTLIVAEHASIARSVAVPADVFVLASVAARGIEFVVEILLVVVLLIAFHHHRVPLSFVLLPLPVAFLLLTTLGLSFPTAALSVFFRDIQHGLTPALTMLMYVSPVFYPAALVPAGLAALYHLNPVTMVLTLFHQVLYEGVVPSLSHLAAAAVMSVAFYLAGYEVFKRKRPLFAEVV